MTRTARAWLTTVVIGLVVLVGMGFLLGQPYSHKPLDDYIAAQKAAGKPVTLREVIGPDPAPETNGAPALTSAAKWMDGHAGDPDTWKVVGPWNSDAGAGWYEHLTDDERRDLEVFFADAKPFFDGVAAALAKPRLRPATQDAAPFSDADIETRRHVIQILAARAIAASGPQDRLRATELLATLAVRYETRFMIDDMFSSWAMTSVVAAIRTSVERGDIDAAAWRARLDGLLGERWLPRFTSAVRLERAGILERLRTADLNGPANDFRTAGMSPTEAWKTVVFDRISARIDAMIKGEPVVRNSPEAIAKGLAAAEPFETMNTDSYPRLAADLAAAIAAASKACAYTGFVTAAPRFAAYLTRTDAETRLARIALAAEEHRAKHGEFPSSLGDLKWAFPDGVPLDPFTEAPFVYEKTATGVRISSAGRLPGEAASDETFGDGQCLVWDLKR